MKEKIKIIITAFMTVIFVLEAIVNAYRNISKLDFCFESEEDDELEDEYYQ